MADAARTFIAAEIAQLQAISLPAAAPLGYGVDWHCWDDLDPAGALTDPTGIVSIAQDAYHAITSARGSLADAKDRGLDIAAMLSKGMTARQLQRLSDECESEIRKDDRIQDVTVVVTFDNSATMRVSVLITPADLSLQPFTLIISATDGETLLQAIEATTV